MNMQGLVGGTDQDHRDDAVEYAAWLMASGTPITVSFNEICPRQVEDLAGRFVGTYRAAYLPAYASWQHSGSAGCNHSGEEPEYGNAIFMRFTPVGPASTHYYTTSDTGSARNIICMKTAVYLTTFTGCSTHLSAPPTPAQKVELRYAMGSAAGGSTASFALGDLNTSRANLLSIYLDSFKEADLSYCPDDPPGYCKRPTGDRGGAVDYIFGSQNTISSPTAWICPVDLSFTDHRPVVGYYTILY